jgi:aryl-phospho-beta-D-glucosidase BglC (GH1 family)
MSGYVAVVLLLVGSALSQPNTGSPAAVRAHHLQHGINASEWFAQSRDYSAQRLRTFTTLDDIARMHTMGFDHVRISIDPAIFDCEGDWKQCERVHILDEVVAKALAEDLAVIIDIHPNDDFKKQLATSDNAVEKFAILWSKIAGYYAASDRERVFYEILNEPELTDHFRWAAVQQKVAGQIRQADPVHTIIVEGGGYADIPDLVRMLPFTETNLIYNFHYYEPHIFTHQGASWGAPFWNNLRQVPFPATPADVTASMGPNLDDFTRWNLTEYGLENWNGQRVQAEMKFVADWAAKKGVPVTCNEFGVYRKYSKPEDRVRWIAVVRRALEENHIGWTMWDYQGGFGVVTKMDGITVEDRNVLQALGLK